jgi:hypothetical protein
MPTGVEARPTVQLRSLVDPGLRTLCFLACVPSAGVLLLKVYGLMPMQAGVLALTLPCTLVLVAVWAWAGRSGHSALAEAIALGAVGGLLATFAYDLVRLPFYLAGVRVFLPIATFGVWIADASSSTRFTDVIGWTYHYANGVAFGIMYALFMEGRNPLWAVLWACLLETIALVSPFAAIFALKGNAPAIAIAYLGHVAYGLPLGILVQRSEESTAWLRRVTRPVKLLAVGVFALALLAPLWAPDRVRRDATAEPHAFRIEGGRLRPDILRIDLEQAVFVFNPGDVPVSLLVKTLERELSVAPGERCALSFPSTGIHQIHVRGGIRSHSSFVVVEPVGMPSATSRMWESRAGSARPAG